MKIFTPLETQMTPPLITSVTTPVRMAWFSSASTIISQPLSASTRFLESVITPSWSFVRIMSKSRTSPILTRSSVFAFGSFVSSSSFTTPACFLPTSTKTSLGVILSTTPCTLPSVLKLLRFSSSISAKLFSELSTVVSPDCVFKTSVILSSTSFIILAGAEAPAVTPIECAFCISRTGRSLLVCASQVLGQRSLQISYNLRVLELFLSPITTIKSDCSDRAFASDCLSDVALHIVSKKVGFVYTFFTVSKHFFH